ncbi:hypothetical protein SEA_PUPPER_29 [Gordonia phage Pupper]|uniref:Uncharacterized protein n=1 Tax=Gordonia phage Pupper TaxID=2571249 RepID=A0A4Y6EIE8_9CAUD|nr:hypothetical protein KHQ83_gp029 [Gordonia phage Pupper]QDF18516.1 hypothetical protein SEA_PUPPER_29 [Gordonia phage Pupper]QDF18749.1 hypothetical protein SEA_SCENTAE_29 [Gordonia phage SCentae]
MSDETADGLFPEPERVDLPPSPFFTRETVEKVLPEAQPSYPECGACGRETDGDPDYFRCDLCGLAFDSMTMEASYIDDEDEPCNELCTNTWHRPSALREGWTFECSPCALPNDHSSDHWHPCRPKKGPSPSDRQAPAHPDPQDRAQGPGEEHPRDPEQARSDRA